MATDFEEPSATDTQIEAHDPYAALRVREFRAYCAGWLFGIIGQQIQGVAVGWDVYHRTGTALSLGIVGGVQAIPVLLLALPAGQLADSFNRRKLILVSLFLSIGCSLGLAAFSLQRGPVEGMYLLLFLSSIAVTLGRPARQAMVPQMVPPGMLGNATTWNTSLFQIASMVGPALGGLIATVNVSLAYMTDAAMTLIYFLVLLTIRVPNPSRSREKPTLEGLITGIRFVWTTKIILASITLDMFAVLFGGATYLLPIYATDILRVGATGFGWLRAAPAIGALVMGMLMAHRRPMQRAGRSLLLAVAGFGVATIIFGISRNFWLSFAMLFLTGAFDNVSVVVRHTLVQLLTPDPMRGRVSAVNSVFIGASNEIGGFESGVTAAWWGPVAAVIVGGMGTLLVVAGAAFTWPSLRRFGSLMDARPEEEGTRMGNTSAIDSPTPSL